MGTYTNLSFPKDKSLIDKWLLDNKDAVIAELKENYEGNLENCGENDDICTIPSKELYEKACNNILSCKDDLEAHFTEMEYWNQVMQDYKNNHNGIRGLINSTLKIKEPKKDIYFRAMTNLIDSKGPINEENRDTLKQFCFLCVKYIKYAYDYRDGKDLVTLKQSEAKFSVISIVTDFMALLTPYEFMQIFPIEKEYRGHKHGFKDYFTVMDELNNYDMYSAIGDKKILHFLWAYHNWDITDLEVERMCTMSDLRRFRGEQGLAEEFFEKEGIESFTYHEKEGYLQSNKTGIVTKVQKKKKRVPKQFKVVKGGK